MAKNMLPSDTAERMSDFGKFEFDPTTFSRDGSYVWQHLQAPYLTAAQSDPTTFIADLTAAVLPKGGWAAYGAHRTIASLIGPETRHPDYDRLLGAALLFLHSKTVSWHRLNTYEQRFWQQNMQESW